MVPAPTKRTYIRPSPLVAAAKKLNVSITHLRRVIIYKERVSKSLLARYQALETQPKPDRQTEIPAATSERNPRFRTGTLDTPSTPPVGLVDSADANYLEAWAKNVVGKLGGTIVVIQLRRCQEVFEHGMLGETIGAELTQVGLGDYDSSQWQPKIRHFFYVETQQVAKALEFLKSCLAKRNLLAFANIAYRDADVWREFYPGIEKRPA